MVAPHRLVSQPKATVSLAGLKNSSCPGACEVPQACRPDCKAVKNVHASQGLRAKSAADAEKVVAGPSELSASKAAAEGELALKEQAARAEYERFVEVLRAKPRPSSPPANYGLLLTVDDVTDDALSQMGVQPHIFRSWCQHATRKRPFLHQNIQDFISDGFDEMCGPHVKSEQIWTLNFEEWGLTKEAAQDAKDILRSNWGDHDLAESIWLGSFACHYQRVMAANTWHRGRTRCGTFCKSKECCNMMDVPIQFVSRCHAACSWGPSTMKVGDWTHAKLAGNFEIADLRDAFIVNLGYV